MELEQSYRQSSDSFGSTHTHIILAALEMLQIKHHGNSELKLLLQLYNNVEKKHDFIQDANCINDTIFEDTLDRIFEENSLPPDFTSNESTNRVHSIFISKYPKRIRLDSEYTIKDVAVAVMGDVVCAINKALKVKADEETKNNILRDACATLQSTVEVLTEGD